MISTTASAQSTSTTVHPICRPRMSGSAIYPSRTNRENRASGTNALTPATEARPTPNPARKRLSTANIIAWPWVAPPRSRSGSSSAKEKHGPSPALRQAQSAGLCGLYLPDPKVRRISAPDRDDGQDSGLLQAEGLRVPELGDLRRNPFLLRLRTAGRRDEAKHQGGVVAPYGPHA